MLLQQAAGKAENTSQAFSFPLKQWLIHGWYLAILKPCIESKSLIYIFFVLYFHLPGGIDLYLECKGGLHIFMIILSFYTVLSF